MTRYSFDPVRHSLIRSWGTGAGDVAHDVAETGPGLVDAHCLRLASVLTELSGALWREYTHPDAASDDLNSRGEELGRTPARAGVVEVLGAVSEPNLPMDAGVMRSYDFVLECAHELGRMLHALHDAHLGEQVHAEVAAEIAAVEAAERGDLSGRAQQAVLLSRTDVSPTHVAVANDMLDADPFGAGELFTAVDPTAAATAAAHWLLAAATVAADLAGCTPSAVISESDDIEALPVGTPTAVLDRLSDGDSPRDVVIELVRDAMLVADGELPNLDAILDQVAFAARQAAAQGGSRSEELRAALLPTRTTPLNPHRPATDLLEDLLSAIRGCWLIYDAYTSAGFDPADFSDDFEDDEVDVVEAEADDATSARQLELSQSRFFDAVRQEARAEKDRLQ